MRLLSIELKNFQRHRKKQIVFARGITTLQGATDSGKSAILRALRWVCLNDFPGDAFIRQGQTTARVSIAFRHQKETHEVVREKNARENTYEVGDKVLRAFGVNVPESVSSLLRVSELNFQGQHDAPFWFHETAGEVSRRLNAIVDLSLIDTVLAKAAEAVRTNTIKLSLAEESLKKVATEQEGLEPSRERIAEFRELKTYNERHAQCDQAARELGEVLEAARRYRSEARRERATADCLQQILAAYAAWQSQAKASASLSALLSGVERNQAIRPPPALSGVSRAYEQWQAEVSAQQELAEMIATLTAAERTKNQAVVKQQQAEAAFHKATHGERCPLCQSVMK